MAECEANYARLMKLLPDLRDLDDRHFDVGHSDGSIVPVTITVKERCKYTTILEVNQEHPLLKWLLAPRFKVRAYHDARMAEVIAFQRKHRVAARYEYPNENMFQPDEKAQLNTFLGEWLVHCLRYGQVQDQALCTISNA
jgi:uncharacterized protein YqiB (DUF1249 family)